MVALSTQDRSDLWAQLMREISTKLEPTALSKTDLLNTINAADTWADANKAAYNAALPAVAQTGLTAAQKARILMYVIERRFLRGS